MLWQNTNVQEMSPSILLWIKGHILSRKDDGGDPRHSYALVVDKVNPGLTDLFVKQARKVLQTPEKGSVLEKLKQEQPERKPAAPKKQEPERWVRQSGNGMYR